MLAPYHPGVQSMSGAGDQRRGPNGHQIAFGDERQRLEAQIADAKERAVAARAQAERRDRDSRHAMRKEVAAIRHALNELEERHRAALTLIEENADREIARLRAEALTCGSVTLDVLEGDTDVG